jgi:RNA polymerase sigma factor (TIGR02999 family)
MPQHEVTRLLREVGSSPECEGGLAASELLPIVYEELRALAAGVFRDQKAGGTLQPTALVHEVYLKLVDQSIDWESRRQFFAVAAVAMRTILVDHARRRNAQKRGGDRQRIPLGDAEKTPSTLDDETVLAIDDALTRLAQLDARKARLVELRFFAGLTGDEAAEALGIARSTASEEWRVARAWLYNELRSDRS